MLAEGELLVRFEMLADVVKSLLSGYLIEYVLENSVFRYPLFVDKFSSLFYLLSLPLVWSLNE